MQLSAITLFALVAAVIANPLEQVKPIQKRQQPSNPNAILTGPGVSEAAMTDRDGRVVSFKSSEVYLNMKEAGL